MPDGGTVIGSVSNDGGHQITQGAPPPKKPAKAKKKRTDYCPHRRKPDEYCSRCDK